MKKHLLVLLSLLLAVMTVQAERISQEDAALVANNFMNAASASGAKKSVKPMKLLKAASATQNQYYVYESADGEGWVMVAANDVVSPILAYSNTGTFRTDNQPANVRNWLGKYDKFITKIEADGATQDEVIAAEWSALRKGIRKAKGDAVVGPLVKTTWDQDAPYDQLCPGTGSWGDGSSKAATGCVATAMAQVMKYWQWPVTGTGSHTYQPKDPTSNSGATSKRYGQQTADFGATTYDWANMKNSYSGSYTNAQATAVAMLMYHCGVATEMMYGNYNDGGSGTYTVNYGSWSESDNAQNALYNYFGYKKATGYMRDGYTYGGHKYYDSWTDADWTAMVKAELDLNHPIMYGGASDEGGHSFICDGYDDAGYFHFNWGWSGSNDGYYKLSSLKPGSGGAGGGGYDFSEDQDVIIGIVPDKPDLPDRNVIWMANGEKFDQTVATGGEVTLPANQPATCANGRVFVGWTATENYADDATAPAYIQAGTIIEADATYYAVYATVEQGSASSTATLIMEDYQAPDGTFGAFEFAAGGSGTKAAYNPTGKDARYYAGNTLTIGCENEMSKIVFNISAQGLKRLAPITADAGEIAAQALGDKTVTWTGSAKSVTFTVGAKADYGSEGSSKAGQFDFTSVEITTGGGTSYAYYSTDCGSAISCELTGITLNTDNVQKVFNVGDTFTSEGLVVTANYSNCDPNIVTASVQAPDMTTAGEKTVVVTYQDQTESYKITVKEIVKYTVTYYACGSEFTKQVYNEGETLVLPSPAPGDNAGKAFYGWIATEHYTGTAAPTLIEAGSEVKADAVYYAVYKK